MGPTPPGGAGRRAGPAPTIGYEHDTEVPSTNGEFSFVTARPGGSGRRASAAPALAAAHPVAPVRAHRVAPRTARDRVDRAVPGVDDVVPRSAADGVAAGAAVQAVRAGAAEDRVPPAAAAEAVAVGGPAQHVGGGGGPEPVDAPAAPH